MLVYGRNQCNIIKQLSVNEKKYIKKSMLKKFLVTLFIRDPSRK